MGKYEKGDELLNAIIMFLVNNSYHFQDSEKLILLDLLFKNWKNETRLNIKFIHSINSYSGKIRNDYFARKIWFVLLALSSVVSLISSWNWKFNRKSNAIKFTKYFQHHCFSKIFGIVEPIIVLVSKLTEPFQCKCLMMNLFGENDFGSRLLFIWSTTSYLVIFIQNITVKDWYKFSDALY
jgi:hypothetical protein